MTIKLTPALENALTKQARKKGTTPEMLALDTLHTQFGISKESNTSSENQGNLADYLSDHIGVLSSSEYISGGAKMSENSRKKFTAGLIKKRQQNRL